LCSWQNYTIYSILFIVFIILIIVTAFICVALTYFQLAVEDHRWDESCGSYCLLDMSDVSCSSR
jgi:hypothetical protein